MTLALRTLVGAAVAGSMASMSGLLPIDEGGHPGPKFIRVNSDGTSQEVPHVSSRFVKARVPQPEQTTEADTASAQAAQAETAKAATPQTTQDSAALDDPGGAQYLNDSQGQQQAMVDLLVAQGLPEAVARVLVRNSPELIGQMLGAQDTGTPAMGCRLKAGERHCM